jgi:hypothetical protein
MWKTLKHKSNNSHAHLHIFPFSLFYPGDRNQRRQPVVLLISLDAAAENEVAGNFFER